MKVDREEFLTELAKVKPALASGGAIQQLSHIWFDKQYAYAYDGGFGVKRELKTELDCGVPGSAFINLLGSSSLKEVELEQSGTGLKLKFGKASSKLVLLSADNKVWPYQTKLPKNAEVVELGVEFVEALRKTLFVKARVPTRVEHYGVMLQKVGKGSALYSTDSASMVCVKLPAVKLMTERVLLPRDFAEQIVAQTPEGVKLHIAKDCLIAEAEGITFYSNLLDISAADDMSGIVERHLSKHPNPVAIPAGLSSALERAQILSGAEEPFVELESGGDTLDVSGSFRLGTVQDNLELEAELPEARLRVDAGLLKRSLAYSENLSLTEGSLILRSGEDFVYVLAAKS